MDGAEVGGLEQADEVGFGRFLEGHERRGLEAEVGAHILGNLADEALEGQLADEELGGLLVAADLADGDGARAVAVGLLGRSRLLGGLGGAGHLAPEVLARLLLGAGHCNLMNSRGSEWIEVSSIPRLELF